MVKVGVLGASGRMGQAVIRAIESHPLVTLGAALVRADSAQRGESVTTESSVLCIDASELRSDDVDVLIDFSLPTALADNLQLAEDCQCPVVVCTTGLDDTKKALLRETARRLPVLYASNTSIGIALLELLVSLGSAALPQADIEIFEAHHRHKKDGPSGTALSLGEAAAEARQQTWKDVNDGIRSDGVRSQHGIGFSVMRAADIVGEHQVTLATDGERLELGHRVSNRKVFADGALHAAQWLVNQKPGLYCLRDTLSLETALQRLLKQ